MNLPNDLLVEMARRILRIRFFEEAVVGLKAKAEIPGAVHVCIGHETTVVGACMAAGEGNFMTGSHRSHGHPIAKGADLPPLMAELLARTTGVCKGKGGSLHLPDFSVGSLGESGIIGSSIPVATGAGLASKLRKTQAVTLRFFGDSASNIGAFHEALNLASAWSLPVVFVCENNGCGVSLPAARATNVKHVAERAAAYGMPGVIVDGQDPIAVYEVVAEACVRARAGDGPTLIDAKTYRFREHAEVLFIADPYGSEEEVNDWTLNRDPAKNFPRRLVEMGVLGQAEIEEIVAEEKHTVEDAVAFARASPMFMNVPGLKIATPASPFDAKGLIKAAIRDGDPVLIFEDFSLWFTPGHVPEEDCVVPLDVADVKRRGSDITISAIAGGVPASAFSLDVSQAAKQLQLLFVREPALGAALPEFVPGDHAAAVALEPGEHRSLSGIVRIEQVLRFAGIAGEIVDRRREVPAVQAAQLVEQVAAADGDPHQFGVPARKEGAEFLGAGPPDRGDPHVRQNRRVGEGEQVPMGGSAPDRSRQIHPDAFDGRRGHPGETGQGRIDVDRSRHVFEATGR
jgi:pyruvate dehydrogenase E1 component alpha subunit